MRYHPNPKGTVVTLTKICQENLGDLRSRTTALCAKPQALCTRARILARMASMPPLMTSKCLPASVPRRNIVAAKKKSSSGDRIATQGTSTAFENEDATANADEPKRRVLPDEYVIESIRHHGTTEDGELVHKVRWYGFNDADDTWEPLAHSPRSKVLQYYRRKCLPLPKGIEQALPG